MQDTKLREIATRKIEELRDLGVPHSPCSFH